MVYKRIHSKEYHFVEQSLYKLETEEAEVAKTGSNSTMVEIANTLVTKSPVFETHQLPSTNPFAFNLSFSQLPDLLFYNTPQLSLLHF